MNELLDLFLTFCRIGGLTFGGGYAMLPMIQKEVVDKRKWATEEEVLDYYAIGQSTPGVIAVNTATFIGYKQKGIPGALSATFGVVFPSLVIITIIAAFISNFSELAVIQYAFAGIRVGVTMLVVDAVLKLWKSGVKDTIGIVIFIIAFCISAFTSVSTILIVISGIAAGILISKVKRGGKA